MPEPKAAVRYRHGDGKTRLRECRSPGELEKLMADRDGAAAAELVTRVGDQVHLVTVVWSDRRGGYLWACECGTRGHSTAAATDAAYALAETSHPVGCPWLLLAGRDD